MKKVQTSIFFAAILAASLFFLNGCIKKHTVMQPIAQTFSPQTESEWIEVNPRFAALFEYLRNVELDSLEIGMYEIDGRNVFLTVSDSELRSEEEAPLEVHDLYYDLHIPISGVESYGYRHRKECLQPKGPMDGEKDIQFFFDPIAATIEVQPMEFIVFAPDDAHAPLIGSGSIRKIVAKILK